MNKKENPILTILLALAIVLIAFSNSYAEVYNGRAVGLTVQTTTNGTTNTSIFADTGPLPLIGGNLTATLPSAVGSGVSTGAVSANTSGALRSSQSSAIVNALDILVGGVQIRAARVSANTGCICCPGADVPSCIGAVSIALLTVTDAAGVQTTIAVTGQPNQVVALPGGIGTITINEQVTGIASIAVNALRVNATVNGTISNIIVGQVSSGLDCLATIPTASDVKISGRVTTASGSGLSRVVVTLTDSAGNVRSTLTNTFGSYKFNEVESGNSYILTAVHRVYTFEPVLINANEDMTVNLVAR